MMNSKSREAGIQRFFTDKILLNYSAVAKKQ